MHNRLVNVRSVVHPRSPGGSVVKSPPPQSHLADIRLIPGIPEDPWYIHSGIHSRKVSAATNGLDAYQNHYPE